MMKNKEIWIYSERKDLYWEYSEEFNTIDEAIKCAKADDEIEDYVFVGKKTPARICDIDVDSLLENIAENTTDGFDEYADGFLENVTKEHFDELEEKLNNVFLEWVNKYNYNPTWFEVIDIKEIEL